MPSMTARATAILEFLTFGVSAARARQRLGENILNRAQAAVGAALRAVFLRGSGAIDRQGERWGFTATSINCEFVYADETERMNACTPGLAWFCLRPSFTTQESR